MKKLPWLISAVCGLVLVITVKNLIFVQYTVDGVSMQPTIKEGKELRINRLSHRLNPIERFDIVVFYSPEKKESVVKRVIGVPGDEIVYKDDQLFVNGERVKEPFLKSIKEKQIEGSKLTGNFTLQETTGKTHVPKDHLFVIGDNRLKSYDSRHFGFIKEDRVIGKVKSKK
ncbi:signal peptidase I [Metabacillus arenae]|uniref:Signal peptidase I n=1 Tax=Metabacillus arenae TaxID=2771434 RepID=A0A926S136_9BACI|nr:signal peptidase I [Metabacillus arenae]MBD1380629.1 signal peptidase I [Metabacillus arenae]